MKYIENTEIIEALKNYYSKPTNKKYEKVICDIITLMANKNTFRKEFIGHTDIKDDMVSNAYYFFFHNLNKGSIKIKNTEVNQVTKTTHNCKVIQNQSIIIIEDNNPNFKVKRVKVISTPGSKVKEIKYLDNKVHSITLDDIAYNDVFAYITSIISTSFWKSVESKTKNRRTKQLIYNLELRNNEYISTNEVSRYDNTTDSENEILDMMQKEAIEYEQGKEDKQVRVRKIKTPKNNLWDG